MENDDVFSIFEPTTKYVKVAQPWSTQLWVWQERLLLIFLFFFLRGGGGWGGGGEQLFHLRAVSPKRGRGHYDNLWWSTFLPQRACLLYQLQIVPDNRAALCGWCGFGDAAPLWPIVGAHFARRPPPSNTFFCWYFCIVCAQHQDDEIVGSICPRSKLASVPIRGISTFLHRRTAGAKIAHIVAVVAVLCVELCLQFCWVGVCFGRRKVAGCNTVPDACNANDWHGARTQSGKAQQQ